MNTLRAFFIFTVLVLFIFITQGSAWLSGYDYRMPIEINNTCDNLTYYQYNFTVDTATLVSASKMNANGNDCRITNNTDVLQSFWNETVFNGSSTKIWVNATALGNVSNTTHYMYYGKSGDAADYNISETAYGLGDDFTGIEGPTDFPFVQRWNLDYYGHQGVASDGTHIYVTGDDTSDTRLAKYNLTGSKIAEDTTAASKGTTMTQVNSIEVYDSKLYVGSNNFSGAIKRGYIKVFNCSDLAYVEEHRVLDHWCEGCSYYDSAFWVVYTDYPYVSKYNMSWGHVADYELTWSLTGAADACGGYQGITWKDDYIFVNNHGNCNPKYVDVYRWNGGGFSKIIRMERTDSHDTQGLFWDGTHMWFTERDYYGSYQNAVSKNTVTWGLVPDGEVWDPLKGQFKIDAGRLTDASDTATHHPIRGNWIEATDYISDIRIKGAGQYGGASTQMADIDNFHAHYLELQTGTTDNVRWKEMVGGSWSPILYGSAALTAGTWYNLTTEKTGDRRRIFVDATLEVNTTDASLSDNKTGIWLYSTKTTDVFVDWIFVHKYASSVPVATTGAEESAPSEAPTITLLSQTPSTIYKNSTGYLNISYGITHDSSGLNNTSVSFIFRGYDYDCACSNHSIRVPSNNLAAEWDVDGRILRAINRNETLNFENNNTITGGDIYSWSGMDENSTGLTIVPINNTYTKVYLNKTMHCFMPQMWYLDRSELRAAIKTQLPIHKNQNVLIKFWNMERFKGNTDFLGVGYTDTSLNNNPTLWPSNANPVNFYYVSSGYDPATGGDPLTSGYAVYMGSLNASGWTDHVYSRSNSNYVRGFIDNNYLHTVVNTTNISYIYFTSNTESSKPYYINMTNVATSTNRTFANTNTLWAGGSYPLASQSYTPNVWFAFMKLNMSLDHKLYAADNTDLWGSSSMSRTNITQALFPPTNPTINHFHYQNETDYNMDGIYSGNFLIGCGVATDPDGGTVTHNLTLHYANNLSLVFIINNTFTDLDITHNGVYFDANFSSEPYYSDTLQYTLKIVAVDDEGYTSESWLGCNFTLTPTVNISGYITNILELPIENARIDINSNYVFTNSSGYYEIFEIIPGLNNITIRAIGYSNKYDRINMINTSISNYTLKERRSPSKAPCFGFILSLIIILTVAFITRKPKQF